MRRREFDDLPSRERIRRRGDKYVYPSVSSYRKRFPMPPQPIPIPDANNGGSLDTWPAFQEVLDGWKDTQQKHLLQVFVINNGLVSVSKRLRNELLEIRTAKEVTNEMKERIFAFAIGDVFQTLTYHSLEESEKERFVPNTYTSLRTFRNLRLHGVSFSPQGMIINELTNPPTLETLCLYRTNPGSVYTKDKLPRELEEAVGVFTRLKGQAVWLKEEPVFSRRTGRGIKWVRISETPDVLVVIPYNREYNPETPFVRVEKLSFGIGALGSVAKAILEDLGVPVPPPR